MSKYLPSICPPRNTRSPPEVDSAHFKTRLVLGVLTGLTGMRKTRRKQPVEIKGRKTRRIIIEGRLITDYHRGLSSANYGLIPLI